MSVGVLYGSILASSPTWTAGWMWIRVDQFSQLRGSQPSACVPGRSAGCTHDPLYPFCLVGLESVDDVLHLARPVSQNWVLTFLAARAQKQESFDRSRQMWWAVEAVASWQGRR